MSNHIESGKEYIKGIFEWWYRVPEYQRPYVWGVEEVNDLLEDIASAFGSHPDSEYFLGSIVLQKRAIEDELGKHFVENDLLDGQQRLTTCLMLHAVARDITKVEDLKVSCRGAIYQKGNQFDGIPERARIIFDIRDEVREFVQKVLITDGGTNDGRLLQEARHSKDASVQNMANAVMEIRRYFASPDAPKVEDFFRFFRTKVLLIYVSSAKLEDAFRMFTVLNDRGMKLRGSDILKSVNLRALKAEGATDRVYQRAAKLWEDLEGELGEDFDGFLSHLRTILVKEKARLNLLQEFEDNIYAPKRFDLQTRKYQALTPLLKPGTPTFVFVKKYHEHQTKLLHANVHITESLGTYEYDNLITLLQHASLSDMWLPPLMHYREVFGEARILDFLRKLENKYCGDWIARETPTRRIENMNAVLKEIDRLHGEEGIPAEKKLEMLLASPVFAFDRAEFFRQLQDSTVYGRRFARYIIYKLDMLCGGPGARLQPPHLLSVEHILPQNPAEDSRWARDFSDDERAIWTNKLGNLVLISGRKNASQGRLDYAEKKRKYFMRNIEPFPNSLRVMNTNETWTKNDVKDNHEKMVAMLAEYTS